MQVVATSTSIYEDLESRSRNIPELKVTGQGHQSPTPQPSTSNPFLLGALILETAGTVASLAAPASARSKVPGHQVKKFMWEPRGAYIYMPSNHKNMYVYIYKFIHRLGLLHITFANLEVQTHLWRGRGPPRARLLRPPRPRSFGGLSLSHRV